METLSEVQNVILTFSRALEIFLVHLQLFDTPNSITFIATTIRRMQKHLQLSVVLVELVGEVSVVLHVAIVDKTTMEEGRIRAK